MKFPPSIYGYGRKQKILLSALSNGRWMHGRALSEMIGVHPDMLWPYMERLRARGLQIKGEAGQWGRGYRLVWRSELPEREKAIKQGRAPQKRNDRGAFV